MKIKRLSLIISCFMLISCSFGQDYAVDKKATIIGGTLSFSSQGGKLLHGYNHKRVTTILFTPTVNYFIIKNLFAGIGMEFSYFSAGGENTNSIGIGPQIGGAFGNSESSVFPYLSAGFRYHIVNEGYGFFASSDNSYSTHIFMALGVIVPVKEHIGLTFEGSFHMIREKYESFWESGIEWGNVASFGVGITGLFFKSN